MAISKMNPGDKASTEILRSLEESGAVTATSLTLTDPNMPYDRFEALGRFLGAVNRSCAFWIGDWLVFGEMIYGETIAQAAEETGLSPQTLTNRMGVCRRIPPERRIASLAFGTHAEVAYLPPKERDAWLKKAAENGWKRANLREAMRVARGELGPVGYSAVTGKSGEDLPQGTSEGMPAGVRDVRGEPVPGPIHTCPHCGRSFEDEDEE